ncbi:MAG: redoxin domain-containing protein [Promethearchaeota archaeon]
MGKKIRVGEIAPKFEAVDVISGKKFKLEDSLKKNPVVLVFSRYFGCPICQADFDKLLNAAAKISEKATLVYITQSKKETIKSFIEGKDVSFTIISDSEEPYPLYNLYNIGKWNAITLAQMAKTAMMTKYKHGVYEGYEKQNPADFIIGTDGKVIHRNYSLLGVKKIMRVLSG